ncbi:MAG TPA: heat-inducible transcriptional repressor HrcA [Candidatus Cybelea sp.]|nr:heat-inducible transcriptional repressor HrcA [Candidatus Cybelea sp.]
MIQELNERSREVFRHLVEAYVETGQPVGSRTLARRLDSRLSPASIRNVMADLEDAGLLYAPHTSAGRLPTEAGLRIFVDGLLELGSLTADERASIEGRCTAQGRSLQDVLREASTMLSGLSRCAGVVIAPKLEAPLKQIEFVPLAPGRALVIIVTESGLVENRVLELGSDLPASALTEASNFLSMRLKGRTIAQARDEILTEIDERRAELDELTQKVVQAGLATWAGGNGPSALIVSGRANLLDDVHAMADLERIRRLFDDLESRQDALKFMELTQGAEGVRIFIGSENKLFAQAGCSLIVAPYQDSRQQIVGALGVIGPTRLNYARIIPMVDYTAQVIGRLIG